MFAAVLDVIAPPRCAGCGLSGKELCHECTREIQRNQPLIICGGQGLGTIHAAGKYAGVLRKTILAFKFANRRSLAEPLAAVLASRLRIECEVIVPVPLHPARETARGYNQAALLAVALARRLQVMNACVAPRALRRVYATRTQSKLDAIAREANVAHAFAPGTEAAAVASKKVLLVDDVFTTGATLRACATVLRLAGAERVDAACIAIKL